MEGGPNEMFPSKGSDFTAENRPRSVVHTKGPRPHAPLWISRIREVCQLSLSYRYLHRAPRLATTPRAMYAATRSAIPTPRHNHALMPRTLPAHHKQTLDNRPELRYIARTILRVVSHSRTVTIPLPFAPAVGLHSPRICHRLILSGREHRVRAGADSLWILITPQRTQAGNTTLAPPDSTAHRADRDGQRTLALVTLPHRLYRFT